MSKFKYLVLSAVTVFLIFLFTGCEVETLYNGDLDGFWHVETIDTLQTGGTYDLSDSKVFWSFQAKLMSVRGIDNEYLFRFNKTCDSLIISNPFLSDREIGDSAITNSDVLRPYGINALEEHFAVEQLSGSKMTLKSSKLRIKFRKF